jgi:hypothetical protein
MNEQLNPIFQEILNKNIKKIVQCPFCDENDFDLIGLKDHLRTDCKIFDSLPKLKSVFHP